MSTYDRLRQLADRYSVAAGYHDLTGHWHAPDESTLRSILAALGLDVATDADVVASLARAQRSVSRDLLPPVIVVNEHAQVTVPVAVAPDTSSTFTWRIDAQAGPTSHGQCNFGDLAESSDTRLADGQIADGQMAGGQKDWVIPVQLPPGYHELSVCTDAGTRHHCQIIVAPTRAFQPDAALGGQRAFGIMLQLYSVRSANNWGIGDLRDVRGAIDTFAPLGADFIGLNPLHAGFLHEPTRTSPYSPSNRRFLNPIYLAVDELDDFRACSAAQAWWASAPVQARIVRARAAQLVDYALVTGLKLEACEFAYSYFLHECHDRSRHARFAAFCSSHGEALEDHTKWEAMPYATGVRSDPGFYAYLQWQTADALALLANHAIAAGMRIGLYLDLAVGVAGDGGEVHSSTSPFADGVTLGAPPDDFSPTGQNWALPPWNPHALRRAAYAPFVDMLRAVMRAGGALRIDHVVGLLRQFWIPRGEQAGRGAYIHFPVRDLLAIIALESHVNQCVVVGEDLGTVPDEMRALLYEHGLLSYRVLYFERYWDGDQSFKKPQDFPADALVTVATHDLPTLAGYFSGHDLQLREALGKLPPGPTAEQQRAHREWECAQLRRALATEGLDTGAPDADALAQAVHTYIAYTPCKLMAVQIEDLLGVEQQVNLPDTVDEHPNWCRRLELPLDAWAQDRAIVSICNAIRVARQRPN